MKRLGIFAFVAFLLMPSLARAAGTATFSLATASPVVEAGERFLVEVWVNPGEEDLDTVRAYLSFPNDRLRVVGVEVGSLFPRVSPGNGFDNDEGTVSIGAFTVGPVVRVRGLLATVTFEAKEAGAADIGVSAASRLISNGEERSDASGHVGLSVRIGEGGGLTQRDSAAISTDADVTPPNPIVPYTPRLRYVEGEDALVEFGTTDDGSGIGHYELSLDGEPFFVATSPYVLLNLEAGDLFIEVKAVDRAGNERYGKTGIRVYPKGTTLGPEDESARTLEQERIREIVASESAVPGNHTLMTIVSAILLILAIIILGSYRKRRRVS
ncbi:hypothetical protein A2304_00665 [Candidatus Uhrbacteria bacterium RIFOXYB2_FULL_57_15]|uniref:Cohesin domain-containing protein n=1 Tax=Candidatus Uhrbacteria bacterium RIFOXYB2_FULL_57_15 TaxID=1802422 RepID=A0A1F7W8P4_9BACT|nr:MAG: hypothetical protein A2304_00665 [Candidatus Uhrbacteria bacterium RIFOXYB2_FULL_57_15]OGL99115.1 MAG: hypothetical protein A2501_00520 [Candidatus Uhrbacteria bacterium RIFOXYC12_FULL_57_11]